MDDLSHVLYANLASDREKLHAFRIASSNPSIARLALFHGYGEHGARHLPFLAWLGERGIQSSSFDFRGQGRSTGRRAYVRHWEHFLDDAQVFLEWEKQTADRALPLFILGHSHGALVLVAAVIRRRLRIDGTILSSPFLRSKVAVPHSKRLLAALAGPIVPWLRVRTGLRDTMMSTDEQMRDETRRDPLMVRVATPRWFSTTLKVQDEVMRRAAEFDQPLLCLAGTDDAIADPEAAADFVSRCGSIDKTMHRYPNLRHELLRETTRLAIYADILTWVKTRVPRREAVPLANSVGSNIR